MFWYATDVSLVFARLKLYCTLVCQDRNMLCGKLNIFLFVLH
jgi:hypothetical protein